VPTSRRQDTCSAPLAAVQHLLVPQHVVGGHDCAAAHGERPGQQPLGGQPGAGREIATTNGGAQRLPQASVQRPAAGGPVAERGHRGGRVPRLEACLPLVAICLLAVLAMRWGYDSRDALRSQEEELAGLGLSWGADTAPPVAPAAGTRLRFPFPFHR